MPYYDIIFWIVIWLSCCDCNHYGGNSLRLIHKVISPLVFPFPFLEITIKPLLLNWFVPPCLHSEKLPNSWELFSYKKKCGQILYTSSIFNFFLSSKQKAQLNIWLKFHRRPKGTLFPANSTSITARDMAIMDLPGGSLALSRSRTGGENLMFDWINLNAKIATSAHKRFIPRGLTWITVEFVFAAERKNRKGSGRFGLAKKLELASP